MAGMIVVGVLAGPGCASSGDTSTPTAGGDPPRSTTPPTSSDDSAAEEAGASAAELIRPLPPAAPLPTVVERTPPVSLTIEALGVEAAPVVPVGVEARGEMEIPGVAEVGWYRFGASPGDEGSAVLAAHIAYNGVDGVFRHLDDLAVGDTVGVRLADGTSRLFAVTELARYDKAALPLDVWARRGPARLVLITCGGEFDAAARSYDDNVVAYATPI
jgi:hypothetical protein